MQSEEQIFLYPLLWIYVFILPQETLKTGKALEVHAAVYQESSSGSPYLCSSPGFKCSYVLDQYFICNGTEENVICN